LTCHAAVFAPYVAAVSAAVDAAEHAAEHAIASGPLLMMRINCYLLANPVFATLVLKVVRHRK
jgi:hypothetical protein